MARLLRSFPEVLILVKGIMTSIRSVCYTLVLLFVIVYMFAIAFVQLLSETDVGKDFFPNIASAGHTLILMGALFDGPADLVVELVKEGAIYALVFYVFVLFATLTVLNMLIGVLCEVVSVVANAEREAITIGLVKDGFKAILTSEIDEDNSGTIKKSEFQKILVVPAAVELLKSVDVDVVGLMELSDFIYEDPNAGWEDSADRELKFEELLEIILDLRGSNTAKVKHLITFRRFVQNTMEQLKDRLASPATPSRALSYSRSTSNVEGSGTPNHKSFQPERLCNVEEERPEAILAGTEMPEFGIHDMRDGVSSECVQQIGVIPIPDVAQVELEDRSASKPLQVGGVSIPQLKSLKSTLSQASTQGTSPRPVMPHATDPATVTDGRLFEEDFLVSAAKLNGALNAVRPQMSHLAVRLGPVESDAGSTPSSDEWTALSRQSNALCPEEEVTLRAALVRLDTAMADACTRLRRCYDPPVMKLEL